MPTKDKDRHHGAALLAIVEFQAFKALNKLPKTTPNVYLVNADTPFLVKYASKTNASNQWQFTVNSHEARVAKRLAAQHGDRFFLVLVCGSKSVCTLDWDQTAQIVDFGANQTTIRCATPKGKQIRVFVGRGKEKLLAAASDFPRTMFKGTAATAA